MSGPKLPDGVPADNTTKKFSSEDGQSFAAPDMATPRFVRPGGVPAEDMRPAAGFHAHSIEEGDDDTIRFMPASFNPAILFGALALVVVAIGVFAMVNNKPGLPSCSTQPEWNQYNCRAD